MQFNFVGEMKFDVGNMLNGTTHGSFFNEIQHTFVDLIRQELIYGKHTISIKNHKIS